MAKPVVFVIGASGNVGSATVQALSAKYADKVEIRAGVRNPEKAEKLKGLPGVTVVKAEMGAKQQLIGTFHGVDTLYIVTPGTENRAELVIPTAEAAKEAGVKFILVVSVPMVGMTDFAPVKQFMEIEGKISKLGVPYAFLRLPYFVDNYFGFKDTIVNQSSIYSPVDPTKPFNTVVCTDAGKAGAAILVNYKSHTNKTYTIVSDRHTYNDVAAEFSKALGKEIKYIRVPYEAAKQSFLGMGFPEWAIDFLFNVFKQIDSGSLVTNQADFTQFEEITGEKPTNLKTWTSQVADAFKA